MSGSSLPGWGAVLVLALGLSFGQNGKASDSLGVVPKPVSDSLKTVAADSSKVPKSRADTVSVVKYRFNHREQIITGGVVMACLALMLTVMNNYNPR